jgi:ubiquinol-cytochrome c reductase cytochrome b subunit
MVGNTATRKNKSDLKIISNLMIQKVPRFGNGLFYSLGFLSMTSFILLLFTGIVMSIFGANWWLTNPLGIYLRSIHLWATQAFVLFIILHLFVVLSTSGFKKPRRFTWVLGVFLFVFALAETEFGYVLRGDFSSQWRSLQGADFYNGSGIGGIIDTLNYKQMYGIHIALIPIIISAILLLHYTFIRIQGLSNPVRKDTKPAPVVRANHRLLFLRGGFLVGLVLVLALIFPSPFIKPVTIQEISKTDPSLLAKTLVAEFNATSDTSTYMDNIDPYTFSTRRVYIDNPYSKLLSINPTIKDELRVFNNQSLSTQKSQLDALDAYYSSTDSKSIKPDNSVSRIVDSLVVMAETGLYEQSIADSNDSFTAGNHTTYVIRLLADTGVLADKATSLSLTTDQYGMLHEESSTNPVGAWWLAPIGVLNHTILNGDQNGDRDAAVLIGLFLLLMVAFPFIPFVSDIPEKLKMHKLFQRK